MTSWQRTIGDTGWLGLFLENHDHPRSVSRFGTVGERRFESAKTLATWYFLMRGTPFIYQGQELGMGNCPFSSIDEYRDIAALNLHREVVGAGLPEAGIMAYLAARSRDHARTPMPWDSSPQAGFTDGQPWIRMNPEYADVNAAAQRGAEDSVMEHYRRLIALRKEMAVFVDGSFEDLASESVRIGGYVRRLGAETAVVWCNFSEEAAVLPEPIDGKIALDPSGRFDGRTLEAWQSVVAIR